MSTDLPLDGAVPLAHWGVIRAQGRDAASFLQGQLTSDVAALERDHARWAGWCSAKGRLLATFLVWRDAEDAFALACSADLLAPTLKRLSMFVLRAQCRLADAGPALALVGLAGPTAMRFAGPLPVLGRAELDAGGAVIRLAPGSGVERALWVGPPAAVPGGLPALAAAHWHWLEVRSGIPTITAATADRFVPQMLNFELVGGVDFGKGCYPGQEVVARSQYRGTIKRRMFLGHCDEVLAAGTEVFHDGDPGQPAGEIVQAAAAPDGGFDALVELKLAATEGGRLGVGRVDGPPLGIGELPYPLPSAAAGEPA
jgi:folate-binding protein YgfZ